MDARIKKIGKLCNLVLACILLTALSMPSSAFSEELGETGSSSASDGAADLPIMPMAAPLTATSWNLAQGRVAFTTTTATQYSLGTNTVLRSEPLNPNGYILTGTASYNTASGTATVLVNPNVTMTLYLDNIRITNNGGGSGILCTSANLTLVLLDDTTNTISVNNTTESGGCIVKDNANAFYLRIRCESSGVPGHLCQDGVCGALSASSTSTHVAAIGSTMNPGAKGGYGGFSNLYIEGGIITARATGHSPAIGSMCGTAHLPSQASPQMRNGQICKNIRISGGRIYAYGGVGCAGIGSGWAGPVDGIYISNGAYVRAEGGQNSPGIGSGGAPSTGYAGMLTGSYNVSNIEITGGLTVIEAIGSTVTNAAGYTSVPGIGSGQSIEGRVGTVTNVRAIPETDWYAAVKQGSNLPSATYINGTPSAVPVNIAPNRYYTLVHFTKGIEKTAVLNDGFTGTGDATAHVHVTTGDKLRYVILAGGGAYDSTDIYEIEDSIPAGMTLVTDPDTYSPGMTYSTTAGVTTVKWTGLQGTRTVFFTVVVDPITSPDADFINKAVKKEASGIVFESNLTYHGYRDMYTITVREGSYENIWTVESQTRILDGLYDELNFLPFNGREFMGWATTAGSTVPTVTEADLLIGNVVVYPVWGPIPGITKEVEDIVHPGDPIEEDSVLLYVIKATNTSSSSVWKDVVIKDKLPPGGKLVAGSIRLVRPGTTIPENLSEALCYDPLTRLLIVPIGEVLGGQSYELSYKLEIDEVVFDDSADPEDQYLGNAATAEGENVRGDRVMVTTEKVYPNLPNTSGTGGGRKPYLDPEGELHKSVANPASPDFIHETDRLIYTVAAECRNADAVWKDVVIRDRIPYGMELDTSSMFLRKPDGSLVHIDASHFNPTTRTLEVPVGDVHGGQSYYFTFEVLVTAEALVRDAEGTAPDLGNIAYATGEKPSGGSYDRDSGDPVYPPGVHRTIPAPRVSKSALNRDRISGQSRVGDTICYAIEATNDQMYTSWHDVVIQDVLPVGVEPVLSSMVIVCSDGIVTPVATSAWDAPTRTISVYVGDIEGGESRTLMFDAVITEEAISQDIGNTARVYGRGPQGGTWYDYGGGSGGGGYGGYGGGYGDVIPSGLRAGDGFFPLSLGDLRTFDGDVGIGAGALEPVYPLQGDIPGEGEGGILHADPEPTINKEVENETSPDSNAHLEDLLTYVITISNPKPGSLWKNVFIFDYLPPELVLDLDSMVLIKPDGSRVKVGYSAFDARERTIIVPIAQLKGGETYTFTYRVRIAAEDDSEKLVPHDIVNRASVTGENPDGSPTALALESVSIISFVPDEVEDPELDIPEIDIPEIDIPETIAPRTGDKTAFKGLLLIALSLAFGTGFLVVFSRHTRHQRDMQL